MTDYQMVPRMTRRTFKMLLNLLMNAYVDMKLQCIDESQAVVGPFQPGKGAAIH